jgi:hypothetical protein
VPFVGDAGGDELGSSVAQSADASIVAIAAPGYRDDMGYVKVYRTDGNHSAQLGQTIYGDAVGDYFGGSMDITADGKTLVCSAPDWIVYDDRLGYVRVFALRGNDDLGTTGAWEQIGQDVTGEAVGDEFGASVSISDDGTTIAIGGNFNDGDNGVDSGHVRMYRLSEDGFWMQIGMDIDGSAADDWSGFSVSLSADGSTVAIGAPHNDYKGDDAGQVTVYRFDGERSSWERLGQAIHGDKALDQFGMSAKLSPDGITLAVGAPSLGGAGYVRVFSLEGGNDIDAATWNQIGQDISGDASGNEFGWSISLSDDSKTLAVGARDADGRNGVDSGRVRIYRMDSDLESNWIQLGDDIDGDAVSDWSGYSVSLSADGNTVAIGSPYSDDNGVESGHVKVFVYA